MRPFLTVFALVFATLGPTAEDVIAKGKKSSGGSVYVRGYTRKDGTYVRPHYRSRPDGNFSNNWSTKGNVNPYTGAIGTKMSPSRKRTPQRSPSASVPSWQPSEVETYSPPEPRTLERFEQSRISISPAQPSPAPFPSNERIEPAHPASPVAATPRSESSTPNHTASSSQRNWGTPIALALAMLGMACWACFANGDRTWPQSRKVSAYRQRSIEEWTKVAFPLSRTPQ